jgi:hypothetical protein
MKTITQKSFIENAGINKSLVRAVIRQLGGWTEAKQSMIDIANNGIDGGFHGFFYYKETVPFFRRNRAAIYELVKETATDVGENPMGLVAGFGCLKGDDLQDSIMRCLGGGSIRWGENDGPDDTLVANALAWFAGEEVARRYADIIKSEND